MSISSANVRSLSLLIAKSKRTLKFLSDRYCDRAGGQGGSGGREHKWAGEEERACGGHEVMKAWENDGVVVTIQVMLPVPTKRQTSKTSQGMEEGVFVCLGQVVLTRQIDESVMLLAVEAVEKVEGWDMS